MSRNGFTKTQRAMLDILADGRAHTRVELHACLPDELGALSNIRAHLTAIRKRLRLQGQDIIALCEGQNWSYRWVRLVSIDE